MTSSSSFLEKPRIYFFFRYVFTSTIRLVNKTKNFFAGKNFLPYTDFHIIKSKSSRYNEFVFPSSWFLTILLDGLLYFSNIF